MPVGACSDQGSAIAAEVQKLERRAAEEGNQFPAGGQTPETDRAILAAGGQGASVRRERQTQHRLSVTGESRDGFPSARVPQFDGVIAVGGGEQRAIRRESQVIGPGSLES